MRKILLTVLACAVVAPGVGVTQEVTLEAPEASDELRNVLSTASLSLALEQDGADAPQDFVAAARADYRRLLTARMFILIKFLAVSDFTYDSFFQALWMNLSKKCF